MPPTQNNDLRTRLFSKFPKKIGPALIGYTPLIPRYRKTILNWSHLVKTINPY